MTLPAPNLDDRRFQDLVDDAKRMVAANCPEWTDHNVSDPGVTVIEAMAFMVDQLLYRLNRVPDRLYIAFLDLLGVTLRPPGAATVDVVLWLSAPQPLPVVVPAGVEASTPRTSDDQSIIFATTRALEIPPRRLAAVATAAAGQEPVQRGEVLRSAATTEAFATVPAVGDALYLGLDDAAPSCVVAFRFTGDVHGVGVDPQHPPLVWQAWDGAGWARCEVARDETGGLNQPGDVVLILPESHAASVIATQRAGWVRCVVTDAQVGYPPYSQSPVVNGAAAFTIGGVVPAIHASAIHNEALGISEGVPAQTFFLERFPVVADGVPLVVRVGADSAEGTSDWTEVDSFAGASADDRVFRVDRTTGQVLFGPAVREADGRLVHYGAVPPRGSVITVPTYRFGGGPRGNVSVRQLSVLRSTVPFVLSVENRRAAQGGIDGETVAEARVRGPLALRTRDRAVTVEDYEELARRAAPGIARVRCVPASSAQEAGGVRLLVVPAAAPDEEGSLRFEDLIPAAPLLAAIAEHIDARRPVGARVMIEPPLYRGVTVVARVTTRARYAPDVVQAAAQRELYSYFDPVTGGPDGAGWPFGRPVQSGEVFAVLQRLAGVELVDEVLLFAADPITGKRGEPLQRIDLDANSLVFSFEHRVRAKVRV